MLFKLYSGNVPPITWTSCSAGWIHYAVSVHCSILLLFVPFIGRYCKPITSHLYLQQIIQMRRPELYNCHVCSWPWPLLRLSPNIEWGTVGKERMSGVHLIITVSNRKKEELFFTCVFVVLYIAFWRSILLCSIPAFSTWLKKTSSIFHLDISL